MPDCSLPSRKLFLLSATACPGAITSVGDDEWENQVLVVDAVPSNLSFITFAKVAIRFQSK